MQFRLYFALLASLFITSPMAIASADKAIHQHKSLTVLADMPVPKVQLHVT
ncbi:hypothetical protein [Marinifaba aquimaris]|uniref:hypothetical protein n=1 Tax=Marinifaba aquimaris TaxID=2741323 RepID=UPI001FE94BAA|nr:hypothetical protein [Marinifaba aquimaris]